MSKLNDFRLKIRSELEAPAEHRTFGSGWISGIIGLILAIASLSFVVCFRFPEFFTLPEARAFYDSTGFRLGVHITLIASFAFGILNLLLRPNRTLGFVTLSLTLLATVLGGSRVDARGELATGSLLGLDWFVLNVLFTGMLFVPFERFVPLRRGQPLFRQEWREDLFYFLVSSLFVQCLTFVSLRPSAVVLETTDWNALRSWIAAQPFVLQVIEIMVVTDLVQYWVHRAFHRIPFLWRFHSVHHSAKSMDWMAGARMHLLEILLLRALTVMPMMVLGFQESAVHAYIFIVYLYSTFIHANISWELPYAARLVATPRFHHWHHGIEREAIDVNFAIHFPLLDRLFGTFYMPEGKWPSGYGIKGHPVPTGYLAQFLYPFRRK